jgi:hypothetical protein
LALRVSSFNIKLFSNSVTKCKQTGNKYKSG